MTTQDQMTERKERAFELLAERGPSHTVEIGWHLFKDERGPDCREWRAKDTHRARTALERLRADGRAWCDGAYWFALRVQVDPDIVKAIDSIEAS